MVELLSAVESSTAELLSVVVKSSTAELLSVVVKSSTAVLLSVVVKSSTVELLSEPLLVVRSSTVVALVAE